MSTFNLAQLQQKQDQLIYTIDELIEMLRLLPSAGYQQVQYYDRNGNLVTKNIPNIGELINQFSQGVNAQMSKTLYVDQVNGSDTSGDGSQNAPFASPKKAIESTPDNANVFVKFLTGGTVLVNNNIVVGRRNVVISNLDSQNPLVFEFAVNDNGTYAQPYGFFLNSGGSIVFSAVSWKEENPIQLITPAYTGTSVKRSGCINLYDVHSGAVYCAIALEGNIDVTLQDFPLITPSTTGWQGSLFFASRGITVTKVNSLLIHLGSSFLGTLIGVLDASIVDSLGNTLTWNDVLGGIIKDANGVPRNVISNLVL